jgi:membrane protein DedA with SNARE-associated domain
VARDLIPFPAGVIRMGVGRFVALSFLGALPFCLALATVGFWAGPSWESAMEVVDKYDMIVLLMVVLPLCAYWLLRRRATEDSG